MSARKSASVLTAIRTKNITRAGKLNEIEYNNYAGKLIPLFQENKFPQKMLGKIYTMSRNDQYVDFYPKRKLKTIKIFTIKD